MGDGVDIDLAADGRLPSLGLFKFFLEKQSVAVDEADLDSAWESTESALPTPDSVVEFLRRFLNTAQLKSVEVYSLVWRRLDLRRLPVMIKYLDVWYVVERSLLDGSLILTDQAGVTATIDEAALRDAMVIWLKVTRKPSFDGPVLKGNLAASMIKRAFLNEPGWIAKVVMATIIVNIIALTTSLFAMQVYDRVIPTFAYATLTTLVGGMLLVIVLDWALKIMRSRILDSISVAVDKRVSQQVFEHLLYARLDMLPRSLGSLAAQVGGLDVVKQFFSSTVVFALVDFPFSILFIAVIGIIGGKIGWVYLSLMPVALILGLITQRRLRDLVSKQLQRSNERQGVLVDAIRGAESIRANNSHWRFSDEWRDITQSIDGYNIQQKAINGVMMTTTTTLSSVAYVSALVVGVWQVEAGLITMGAIIACSIIGGRIIAPMSQLVQYLAQWQIVSQSLQLVDNLLKIELDRDANKTLLVPDVSPNELLLEKVRFAYPGSPVQQVDIKSLRFKSGERVLLLGAIGSGKSTLLKVMAGLYCPNEGRIRLGDADMWEIDPQFIAGEVGYLPQQVHLFKGSLKNNLTLSGASSDSRLIKIIRDLEIDDIVANSPLGMDYLIAEGGDGLSGGQKQLVGLARLLITQPRVWLLDEPSASLDAETEAKVFNSLKENVRDEDILILSTHRPMQALKIATRVIVMKDGAVVMDGPPDKVMPKIVVGQQQTKTNMIAKNAKNEGAL